MADRGELDPGTHDRSDAETDGDAQAAAAPLTPVAEAPVWTLAWFPPGERERALALWPDLAEDLDDDEAYRRALEAHLRELDEQASRHPRLAALIVDDLLEFAAREGLDPGTGEARSRYAAQSSIAGTAEPWPPGRNDPCWCRSGRKYKRCCGAL